MRVNRTADFTNCRERRGAPGSTWASGHADAEALQQDPSYTLLHEGIAPVPGVQGDRH